jgi:NAD(P)-dependent dehydrogenase (short-subunit alcohol dehydrogenase family)
MADLRDRVAIVTGSSHGIGRGIALRLARDGAHVIVNGRDAAAVEDVRGRVEALGVRSLGVPADVSDADQVGRLFDAWSSAFERLDIVVNCAGIWQDTAFERMDRAEWDEVIGIHLGGFFNVSRRATDIMIRQGGGAIVSVSSIGDLRAHERGAAYDAAKGAILAATRALAVDLGRHGIRVNAVSPGPIRVDKWDRLLTEEAIERLGRGVPLGRVGHTDEVAAVVAFLASDEASFITGQTVYIDGGLAAQARPPSGRDA